MTAYFFYRVALQISPTVGSLAETTLSCEFQQRQQPHRDDDDDDDDVSCDEDELCYSGALDDDGRGPVDVPMSRPLVANCRRYPAGPAAPDHPDAVGSARTHCCFNQHVIIAHR